MTSTPRPRDPSFTVSDIDVELVADDLADALDPADAAALHALLSRDAAARARHDEVAGALDGLASVLAAEPVPAMPDDVLIRLDAALAREATARVAEEQVDRAHAAQRAPAGRGWGGLGRWAAGLLGTAAAVGGLLLVIHLGAGGSTGSSASTAAASQAVAAPRAPAVESGGSAADRAAAPLAVTARSLESVVRGLLPVPAPGNPSGVTSTATPTAPYLAPAASAGAAPEPRAAVSGPESVSPALRAPGACVPAGVPSSAAVLTRRTVSYAGADAQLVVLREAGAPAGQVRADVFRSCGSPVLLSRTVDLAASPAG